MTPRPFNRLLLLLVALCATALASGCTSAELGTETGNPPVINKSLIGVSLRGDELWVTGSKGAVQPGGTEIEITHLPSGNAWSVVVERDGSFEVKAEGEPDDVFEIAVVGDLRDGPTVTIAPLSRSRAGTAKRYAQVVVDAHACVLRHSGSLLCWGHDGYGKVSEPNASTEASFVELAAGNSHTCGLRANGSIICWGPSESVDSPSDHVIGPNADSGNDYVHIAAGGDHTCALREDGTFRCWGEDSFSQVSQANADGRDGFVQLSMGQAHTCGLRADGSLTCWGGKGSEFARAVDEANAADGRFSQVAVANHTCALRAEGSLSCWGVDGDAEAGVTYGHVSGPNRDQSTNFVQVAVGPNITCGLQDTGVVTCWGIGDDEPDAGVAAIGPVSGANTDTVGDLVQIDVGWINVCGLRSGGEVVCWGDDRNGVVSGAP